MPHTQARAGMTLVELLVVLTLISIVMALSIPLSPPRRASAETRRAASRLEAARSGSAVRVQADSGLPLLFLPDGQALGPGLDPLSGSAQSHAQ